MSTQKIRILHTIRQGKIGGGESHVLDLCRHLNPEYFHSTVLSFSDGEMVECLAELGVHCEVISTSRAFDFSVWKEVKSFMDRHSFDLIHAHGTRACSNSYWAAQKLQIPLYYTVHGWSFHAGQSPLLQRLRRWGERFLVSRSQHVILVSHSNLEEGKQYFPIPEASVISNGVDLRRFDPATTAEIARAELEVPAQVPIIALIARLSPQKDPLSFIRAAKGVIEAGESAHFLLVGNGELFEASQQLIVELELEPYFSLPGFRSDIPELLKLIDIYCLPSLWEGLPIGILEAMAMKKAVICSPVDGSREVVKHEVTGLLVNPGQVRSLTKAMLRLLRDTELRESLAEAGHELVQKKFTIEKMTSRTSKLYSKLLAAHATEEV